LSSFGPQLVANGRGVGFRLWAPASRSVDVAIEGTFHPMQRHAEGWFEALVPSAAAGTLYRFRIDGGELVPDPASRFQPQDVDGPSEVIDTAAFRWAEGWQGRPWREAVI
jgi:1,4-alpha-glucan branching enzyme